jgi:hypothetical protein
MVDIPMITFVFDRGHERFDDTNVIFSFFQQRETGIGGDIASVEGRKGGLGLNRGEFDRE